MRQKIPKAAWALVLILGLIGWKGYGVYSSYQRGVNPDAVQAQEQIQQAESIPEMQVSNRAPSASMGGDLTATLFVPTLAEKPESARADFRPLVGCDVILMADRASPLLTQISRALQFVVARLTVVIVEKLPQTIGHEWVKGAGWQEVARG